MSIVLIITIILVPHLARVQTITATETKASREAQAILSMLLDTVFIELIEDVEDTVLYRLGRFEETVQEPKTEDILNKEAEIFTIKVYPNPAKDQLIIEIPEGQGIFNISIYSMLGETIVKEKLSDVGVTQKLDISKLPNGVYLYEIGNNGDLNHNGKLTVIK